MKITELPQTPTLVEVKPARGPVPAACVRGTEVTFKQARNAAWRMFFATAVTEDEKAPRHSSIQVNGATAAAARMLRQRIENPWPKLCAVATRVEPAPDRSPNEVSLAVAFFEFAQHQPWPEGEELTIGISEPIRAEVAKRMERPDASIAEAAAWLEHMFVIPPMLPGRAERARVAMSFDPAGGRPVYLLHGNRMTAQLSVAANGRVTLNRLAASADERLTLLEIPAVRFLDTAETPPLSALAKGLLSALSGGTERYLKLWTRYRELERQKLEQDAAEVGVFAYQSFERERQGAFRFVLTDPDDPDVQDRLHNLREKVEEEPLLLMADAKPPPPPSKAGEDEQGQPARPRPRRHKRGGEVSVGLCGKDNIDPSGQWIEIEDQDDSPVSRPPDRGYLFLSQRGKEAMIERRELAQDGIRRGLCPMPQLGLLLENQPLPFRPAVSTADNLTPLVRRQFKGEPAFNQQRAVNVAVNTPDIALIQGPPGTGKTQVITAIMKRLEETSDPAVNPDGLFLVTSHQHVAVENVMDRILPFGLPAVKIGRRRDAAAGEDPDALVNWLNDLVAHLDRQNASARSDIAAWQQLQAILGTYVNGQHLPEDSALALDTAAKLAAGLATEETCARALRKMRELREQASFVADTILKMERRDRAYRAVYGLRHNPTAFADDGPLRAMLALEALQKAEHKLAPADETLFKQMARGPPDARLLAETARLRERLLQQLVPDERPAPIRTAPLREVGAILADLAAEARSHLSETRGGLDLLLQDLATDVKVDRTRVLTALRRYAAARAETCQGSWRTLRAALSPGIERRGFETVIVDEAARANPLDLLIPLAQARRRIILVGDHRQLPHTLEPDLKSVVEETFEEEERRALEQSLFERLFEDFQRRERDGEPPRTVRLDTQYRMHRILGDFVSEQFYKFKVHSVLADENFTHNVKLFQRRDGTECVASWIDVPARDGVKEDLETIGESKSRPLEVVAIRRVVSKILTEPEYRSTGKDGPKIGIISFYSAQVELLRREFRREIKEKLLDVGTVDAFQGKEFPIVILSVTRSNRREQPTFPPDEAEIKLDRWRRSRFGHLMLQNRMCVALSRQQRLLIVVGDRHMLQGAQAERAIAPLTAFDRLCGEKGLRFRYDLRNRDLIPLAPAPQETVA